MSERELWKNGTLRRWPLTIFNASGAGVTGRAASITTKLALDTGTGYANSAVTVTVTEVDSVNLPGVYAISYTPNATGSWVCTAIDTANMTAPWKDEIRAVAGDLGSLAIDASGGVTVGAVAAAVISASSFAANALGAVWDELTSAHSVAGSFAALLKANLDTNVGSRLAASTYTAPLSSAQTASAVWDEPDASHATAGTTGKLLAFLDAAISSRLASSAYTTPPTTAQIAAAILAVPANLLTTDASGRVTVGSIVSGAIDAAQITAGAAQFVADQLLDRAGAIDGVATVRQVIQWLAAPLAGKNAPGSTRSSPSWLGLDNATVRVSAVVDATTGQRTSVTRS